MTEIRTAEELIALPDESLLINAQGHWEIDGGGLWCVNTGGWQSLDETWNLPLPMTLLHRPDYPSQMDLHAAVLALCETAGEVQGTFGLPYRAVPVDALLRRVAALGRT